MAVLILAIAVVGAVLWGTAVVGVAQFAEDLCFDDLDGRAGYGAFRTDSDLWPPSYECRLLGNDVEPVVVRHPDVALARLSAVVVLPVTYAVAATLGTAFWRRRRRAVSPRSATPPRL